MDVLMNLTAFCSTVGKTQNTSLDPLEDASEIQLNAFEFRNYRCAIDAGQQKLLERVVNQWCAQLVKGKRMKVNDEWERVYIDKDMLTIEILNMFYPLKAISRLEMFQDEVEESDKWALDVVFSGAIGETTLKFNFDQERSRLNFTLALRILRTRDPTLDPSNPIEVMGKEEDEEPEPQTFGRMITAHRYGIAEGGIPIVFSVSDLKIIREIRSSSRHSYLEFFVKYPRQDKFLYAKSPTTHIPQNVLLPEDTALRRKREKKDEQQEEEERKKEETKRKVLGDEVPLAAMRFELKNVKLKIPRVPHTVFGRLMAKDDYFPTAIGTFDFDVTKKFLMNKMSRHKKKHEEELPLTLSIPLMSSYKMKSREDPSIETFGKIGILTIRIQGYVSDGRNHDQDESHHHHHHHEEAPVDKDGDGVPDPVPEGEEEGSGSGSGSGSGEEEGEGSGSGEESGGEGSEAGSEES
mmetsp:Transcript_12408/g.36863  ORF Transcript_12408/g.36863 Transcript_12408/m.36863 type:complete len:465 (+) Transcript_12408:138-1532(+)